MFYINSEWKTKIGVIGRIVLSINLNSALPKVFINTFYIPLFYCDNNPKIVAMINFTLN